MPASRSPAATRRGLMDRFLDAVEWLGNLLPHPVTLFALLSFAVVLLSGLLASLGLSVPDPRPAGGTIEVISLLNAEGLRRILQNLLGNAVDHGEGRPVVVYVDSDADAVAIAVRDYGIGMDADALEQVFERFWRADPSRQRTTGGTGLGLAISTEDAHLHGGVLDVWSEPGEGSCFRLTLPRRAGTALVSSPLELPPVDPVDAVLTEEVADA